MATRRPAGWMRASDDRILEFLDEKGVSSVKTIDESDLVNYNYETIRRRTKILAQANLLEAVGNGVYQIAPKGRSYLSGDADLSDEEKPD